jgi:hypothetical protein
MRPNEANLSGKMCIGYIRCRRGLTRAFGLDAACSVRLTAASASEGKRMDINEPVLADRNGSATAADAGDCGLGAP